MRKHREIYLHSIRMSVQCIRTSVQCIQAKTTWLPTLWWYYDGRLSAKGTNGQWYQGLSILYRKTLMVLRYQRYINLLCSSNVYKGYGIQCLFDTVACSLCYLASWKSINKTFTCTCDNKRNMTRTYFAVWLTHTVCSLVHVATSSM